MKKWIDDWGLALLPAFTVTLVGLFAFWIGYNISGPWLTGSKESIRVEAGEDREADPIAYSNVAYDIENPDTPENLRQMNKDALADGVLTWSEVRAIRALEPDPFEEDKQEALRKYGPNARGQSQSGSR